MVEAKIIRLVVKDFKRIRAVDITPQGDRVVLKGKNYQGKTSCLDAIESALGGERKAPDEPIRQGAKRAEVVIDMGAIKVTKRWTSSGPTLTITDADGFKKKSPPSPQALLNAMVGAIAFDPLEFARDDDAARLKKLLSIVDLGGVDLVALDKKRAVLYDKRRDVGRDRDKAKGAYDTAKDVEVGALVDVVAETDRLQALLAAKSEAESWGRDVQQAKKVIEDLRAELASREKELAELEAGAPRQVEQAEIQKVQQTIREAEQANTKVRAAQTEAKRKAELGKVAQTLAQQYVSMTTQIEAIDKTKHDALKAANFPIEGLSIENEIVTYKGVPFSQASQAERIHVSAAIAMAANPALRVILVRDASVLDDDSMKMLETMAQERGHQLWLEVVDTDDPSAILIENGIVAGSDVPEEAEAVETPAESTGEHAEDW